MLIPVRASEIAHSRLPAAGSRAIAEVEAQQIDIGIRVAPQDLVARGGGALVVAAREDGRRPGAGQGRRRLETDPAVRAGDDRDSAVLGRHAVGAQPAGHATDLTSRY